MHVGSIEALLVFSASGLTAAQETQWYCVYAGASFLVVAIIAPTYGQGLVGTAETEDGVTCSAAD